MQSQSLDVTLNLSGPTYRPFHKSNEETFYIHVKSDHRPQIIKTVTRPIKKDYPDYRQQSKYFKI